MKNIKPVGSHIVMTNGRGTVIAGLIVGYKDEEIIVDLGNSTIILLDETWYETK